MEPKTPLEIIEFTDPVCTWCWGSEPILRTLEAHYKDQITIGFIMGGLVKDIRQFYDEWNHIGGHPEASNRSIISHWREASHRHGMPIKEEGFALFSSEFPSSYPQNIAYKAAQMQNVSLANRFLRRIREATAAEARVTSRMEVMAELVAEVGLDLPQWLEHMQDGSAQKAFEEDQKIMHRYGVTGFPSFLIRYGKKEMLLRGFQKFSTFQSAIHLLSGGRIHAINLGKTPEDVLDFIASYDRVVPREIEEAFDFPPAVASAILATLEKDGVIQIIPAGNGAFVKFMEEKSCLGDVCGI